MKKIIFLIPVFNDWDSLKKLITEIDFNINVIKNFEFECLVVNDSSSIQQPEIQLPSNLKSIKILNMKKNRGHARCNAFGIRYISQKEHFDYIILMDGDGEDRPNELKSIINKISEKPDTSVVAKRIKRAEGPIFQFLYKTHKIITYIFTGELINFGNYSCLIKKDVKKLSTKASLWSSYSGTVKNLLNLSEVNSIRGLILWTFKNVTFKINYSFSVHNCGFQISSFNKVVFNYFGFIDFFFFYKLVRKHNKFFGITFVYF